MGSGKSTVGPILAAEMGWRFLDLDEQIEAAIQMPIAAFFREEGESAFRIVERRMLDQTKHLKRYVVAVGGGALCSQTTLDWAMQNGVVVYLDVSMDELISRLRREQETRPMLLGSNGKLLTRGQVKTRIAGLLKKRLTFYGQAQIRIETDGKSIEDIASEVALAVSNLGR